MAKKKVRKKSNFKYGSPRSADSLRHEEKVAEPSRSKIGASEVVTSANYSGYKYVTRDLSRVAILTIALVFFQVVLWYLVNHTSAVPIYDLIKL